MPLKNWSYRDTLEMVKELYLIRNNFADDMGDVNTKINELNSDYRVYEYFETFVYKQEDFDSDVREILDLLDKYINWVNQRNELARQIEEGNYLGGGGSSSTNWSGTANSSTRTSTENKSNDAARSKEEQKNSNNDGNNSQGGGGSDNTTWSYTEKNRIDRGNGSNTVYNNSNNKRGGGGSSNYDWGGGSNWNPGNGGSNYNWGGSDNNGGGSNYNWGGSGNNGGGSNYDWGSGSNWNPGNGGSNYNWGGSDNNGGGSNWNPGNGGSNYNWGDNSNRGENGNNGWSGGSGTSFGNTTWGGGSGTNGGNGGTNGNGNNSWGGTGTNSLSSDDLKSRIANPLSSNGVSSWDNRNGSWKTNGTQWGGSNYANQSGGVALGLGGAAALGAKGGSVTEGTSSKSIKGSKVRGGSSQSGSSGILDILGRGTSRLAASVSPGSASEASSGSKAGLLAGAGLAMGGAVAAATGYVVAKKKHFYTFTPDDWEDLDKITQQSILEDFTVSGFNEAEVETFKNSTFKILASELDEHIKKIEEAYDNNENLEIELKEMYNFSAFDDSDKVVKYLVFVIMLIDGKNSIDTYNLYNILNPSLSESEDADFIYAGINMEEYIYDENQDEEDIDEDVEISNNPVKSGNSIDAADKEWLSGIGLDN